MGRGLTGGETNYTSVKCISLCKLRRAGVKLRTERPMTQQLNEGRGNRWSRKAMVANQTGNGSYREWDRGQENLVSDRGDPVCLLTNGSLLTSFLPSSLLHFCGAGNQSQGLTQPGSLNLLMQNPRIRQMVPDISHASTLN